VPDVPCLNFGNRLKALRREAGLSVAALARQAGLGRTHVYNLEAGYRNPSWGTLRKLAGALGVSTDAFRPDTPPPAG
jgi:transcriptional regulator with XRE-family HTH domain